MKLIYTTLIGLLLLGCAPITVGDYVTYTSDKYLFMQDNFINQRMDCLELGKMKKSDLNVKYCVGRNYAAHIVQGFIFEHDYTRLEDRFIGAKLTFKAKNTFVTSCSSETIAGASSGKEYINCMVPEKHFNIYAFIVRSKKDVNGQLRARVGNTQIYNGAIDERGKTLLKEFYKNARHQNKDKWKEGSL
ncbi:hypothetical protein JHD50_00750 [Sulfurimonas sp. MAG313]|nr:hypothetical protein [Sulfurimonas sp. MAG313]MDF1879841.1 hypothetical protein [Sulfurimonas sp. MAG313]